MSSSNIQTKIFNISGINTTLTVSFATPFHNLRMNTLIIEISHFRLHYHGAYSCCCCDEQVSDRGPIIPEGLPVNVLQKLSTKSCKSVGTAIKQQKQLNLKYKNIGKNMGKKAKFVAILIKILNEDDDTELGEFYLTLRIVKKLKFEGKEQRGYTSRDLCHVSDLFNVDSNRFIALCLVELELN